MSLEFEVLLPEEFLIKHIETGRRPDGRKLLERRPISISSGNIKSADGSSIVKQGNTTVACGIKAELAKPTAEKPDQGFIVPNLILPNMCHPSVKPGPPSPTAQELSVFIKDVILASECLKLTQLCPVVGKMAWVLYIDVVCLDHDGNLRDASIAAAMAALNSLRLPEVEYDEEMDQITVSKSKQKLNIMCNPVCCSFSVFNVESSSSSSAENSATEKSAGECFQPSLVADSTYSEEEVANSEISFVLLEKGEICLTNQTGSRPLTEDNMQKAISLATNQAQEIRNALQKLR